MFRCRKLEQDFGAVAAVVGSVGGAVGFAVADIGTGDSRRIVAKATATGPGSAIASHGGLLSEKWYNGEDVILDGVGKC